MFVKDTLFNKIKIACKSTVSNQCKIYRDRPEYEALIAELIEEDKLEVVKAVPMYFILKLTENKFSDWRKNWRVDKDGRYS